MEKNGANKGVSMALHSKEGLEQLKIISILETAIIKAELSAVRNRAERAEQGRYKVANLQSQMYNMRT